MPIWLRAGELPGLGAQAGHVEGRVWLLHRPRPDRDRAVLVIAAEPAERPRLGPGAANQMQRLGEALARLRRIDVVGHVFVRCAAHHAGYHPPAGHRVEHRQLFGDPHRVQDRQRRPQDRDLGTADDLAQRTRHDHRVWGQREARIMVLGNRHPVEAEFVGATELIEGGLHRPHGRIPRIIFARERPDVVGCGTHVARGAEE